MKRKHRKSESGAEALVSGIKILNEVQEGHSSGSSYHLLFLADVATTMLAPRFAEIYEASINIEKITGRAHFKF